MMPGVAIAVLVTLIAAYLLLMPGEQDATAEPSLLDTLGLGGLSLGLSDSSPSAPASQPNITPGFQVTTKVVLFSQAIAHAEGFGIAGTVPTRFHNPGDLGPGDCGSECLSATFTAGSNVCMLRDDATGWALLYQKIQRIFDGHSSVYNVNMTIEEFAKHYAGDWGNWSRNVAAYLGVTPQTTVRDWLAR